MAAVARYLAEAAEEGFVLRQELRSNGSRRTTYLVGTCPVGHAVAVHISNWQRGARCATCATERRRQSHVEAASRAGFRVTQEARVNPTGMSVAWLVGTCPAGHPFEMRHSNFKKGQECPRCATERIEGHHLKTAEACGYNVEISRANGRIDLVGRCPEGHDFRMLASNFAKGRRCRSCADHGFNSGLPGIFYVLTGVPRLYANSPNALGDGDRVIKYGVFNPGSGRLEMHVRKGFDPYPLRCFFHEDGGRVAALEAAVRRGLEAQGVPTCSDAGLMFDGCSEAVVESGSSLAVLDGVLMGLVACTVGLTSVAEPPLLGRVGARKMASWRPSNSAAA